MILSLLVFGALFGMGLFMIRRPEAFYARFESWKIQSPSRPSKAYLWNTRLSGAVAITFGVIGIIMTILDTFGLLNAFIPLIVPTGPHLP